jgi:hypothetical protein
VCVCVCVCVCFLDSARETQRARETAGGGKFYVTVLVVSKIYITEGG